MYYIIHIVCLSFFWHFLMWHVAGLTIDNFNLPNKGSSKGGKMFSSHACAFDGSLTLCLSRYVPIWSWFMICSVLSTCWMIMAARKGGKLWTPFLWWTTGAHQTARSPATPATEVTSISTLPLFAKHVAGTSAARLPWCPMEIQTPTWSQSVCYQRGLPLESGTERWFMWETPAAISLPWLGIMLILVMLYFFGLPHYMWLCFRFILITI